MDPDRIADIVFGKHPLSAEEEDQLDHGVPAAAAKLIQSACEEYVPKIFPVGLLLALAMDIAVFAAFLSFLVFLLCDYCYRINGINLSSIMVNLVTVWILPQWFHYRFQRVVKSQFQLTEKELEKTPRAIGFLNAPKRQWQVDLYKGGICLWRYVLFDPYDSTKMCKEAHKSLCETFEGFSKLATDEKKYAVAVKALSAVLK